MKLHISVLLKFLLTLGLLLLTQLAMYLLNTSIFSIDGFADFISIFIGSLRFGISSIVVFLSFFIVLSLLPIPIRENKYYKRSYNFFYVLGTNLILALNCIDLAYYKFTYKRITYDFFNYLGVGGDFKELIPQFARDYWHIVVIFVVLNLIFHYLRKLIDRKYTSELIIADKKWYIKNTALFILLAGLFFIGQRGGLQLRPLSIVHANYYTSSQNTPLVLNTPFTLYRTWGRTGVEKKEYFKDEKELRLYFNPIINPREQQTDSLFTEKLEIGKTNVVVIIVESFSEEYMKGYTPFLSSLAKKSIVFNGYANAKRSIDGVPAVLSSLPLLNDESFITSQYGSNNLSSFASLLKPFNYKTSFFHGGYNGSMGFDAFTKNVGYDDYYGRREYNNDKDYDGNWGIFDEPFLQYMVRELDHYKEPFTSAVFTLSSHHPYTIPPQHKGRFPKGTMIVHETVGYADYALKRFFEEAEKKPWFKNTLFIITADHSAATQQEDYLTLLGKFKVPIIFYHPNLKQGLNTNINMQQADILPTAMSMIGYRKPFIAFGKDALSKGDKPYVLYVNGEYMLREGDYLCKYNEGLESKLYFLPSDANAKKDISRENKELLKKMTLTIQAIIQEYNTRLIENSLVIKDEKR
ncbi:MAG: sulfatase-like hydrolase/transferase [Bacteroidales bacterium]|nr:sulfatase-like hydrolase/transferase [Bacteroidales bacterium]